MKCVKCGRENPEHKIYCGWCASPLNESQSRGAVPSEREAFHKTESNLKTAGIFLIIAGLFAFIQAGIFFVPNRQISPLYADLGSGFWTDTTLSFCGSVEILLGAIIIYGGVHTIRRTKCSLSIMAAALAIISVGLAVSLVLGILALVIILQSRDDFSNR